MCAREGEVGGRRAGLPDVLAHRRADEGLAAAQEHEVAAGLEVPVFVEDAVVGEELLLVDGLQLAVDEHRAGVEQVAVEVREADEGGDPLRRGRDLVQRSPGGPEEAGPEKQVFGRVAGDGQLREEDEVGACLTRLFEAPEDPVAVAVEVADDRVDLGEREAHALNSSCLRLAGENY